MEILAALDPESSSDAITLEAERVVMTVLGASSISPLSTACR